MITSVVQAQHPLKRSAVLKGNNSTEFLNTLFNSREGKITLNKGVYLVDSLIFRTDNVLIDGSGSQIILNSNSACKYFALIMGKNIKIKNINFKNEQTSRPVDALRIYNSKDITVESCSITEFYGKGVDIVFSDRVNVIKNRVSSCRQGIQFWGGDAKLRRRKTFVNFITISGNIVSNIENGGIWGSCGRDVLLDSNYVSGCGDVGIDFEGCSRSYMKRNTVSDCKNACISFFYGCNDIVAENNKAYQGMFTSPGIKFFGSNFIHSNIVLRNNELGNMPFSIGISFDKNSASLINITDNRISDCKVGVKAIDCDNIMIEKNIISASNNAINNEGGSKWKIENNIIKGSSNFQAEIGIRMYYRSSSFPSLDNIVQNNEINGFHASILEDIWAQGILSSNLYRGNKMETFYVNKSRIYNKAIKSENRLFKVKVKNQVDSEVRVFGKREFKNIIN